MIAEYALVRSRRARLEVLRDEGARGAGLALEQLDNVNKYISAVQIGRHDLLDRDRRARRAGARVGARRRLPARRVSHGVAVTISAVLAFAVITSVQLIGGEMVPKFYAIDRAESRSPAAWRARCRRSASSSVRSSSRSRPSPTGILRLLGHRHARSSAAAGSSEELKRLIAESHAGGQIDPGEAGMLRGVFHLHEQEARQVMTPIPAVVTVDISQDVADGAQRCASPAATPGWW